MSAFMCAPETIQMIAAHMKPSPAGSKELYKELVDMNKRALVERYGPEGAEYMVDDSRYNVEDFDVEKALKNATGIRLHIAFECYLYQCHEGNVPKSDLYKQVEACAGEHGRNLLDKLIDVLDIDTFQYWR